MYGSSEQDALVGNKNVSSPPPAEARAPTKRCILVVLAALVVAIVTYIVFWPHSETVDVVVVEEEQPRSSVATTISTNGVNSIVHRPVCEYWSANSILFQEGTQTSMTQPSHQWANIACFPVTTAEESTNGDEAMFLRTKKPTNPLKVDNYAAPDAILQVNFSQLAFGDRPPIYGFGGAFTEASALNWKRLSEEGKEAVLELLFGKSGLGYSIGRVHMNSCDFSVKSYSFDEVDGDFDLKHFDIGVHHDVESGMVEMAKRATSTCKEAWGSSDGEDGESIQDNGPGRADGDLLLYASPWSPPAWMKNPTWEDKEGATHAEKMTFSTLPTCLRDGVGKESPYAAAWALYFSKYISAYRDLGLDFWGVTVQNEPEFPAPWEACAYTPFTETDFVANHLGPQLEKDHPDVKLLVFDHNKDHVNTWAHVLLNETLGARQYVDGIAYHWYAGGMDRLLDGALGIPNMHRLQDNLKKDNMGQQLVLGSESCHCPTTGYAGGDISVIWARAERYAHTILADLAAGSNGWVEWNLLLDTIGGPNHLGNLCESTLLAAPHRAKDALSDMPPLPDFEKDKPFGKVNIGDGRTREELNALGFPAEYLDVGVVVQPIFYYMGHISRYVRPGSYAVPGLITGGGGGNGRIFRPKDSTVMGGGENSLARNGIELTMWPCEGSTRQKFYWNFDPSQKILVHGHDWLGHPTESCIARFVDEELMGLRLTDCKEDAGLFSVVPLPAPDDSRYHIVLLNHPWKTTPQCLMIEKLGNNGGANGPLGGAQVVVGECEDSDESAKWSIDAESGEASSTYLGDEICMTTGWPFLQMGAFVTPGNNKTVVLLNEANDAANFVLQDEDNIVLTSSIPPRSIQTYVLK
mmetsp:Transcript_12085/g.33429  ORF Transcript_12085/g.33429 Transcript_12085/m.33429 type:complete len:863 (+) Transcript_12085:200-2788(+)